MATAATIEAKELETQALLLIGFDRSHCVCLRVHKVLSFRTLLSFTTPRHLYATWEYSRELPKREAAD